MAKIYDPDIIDNPEVPPMNEVNSADTKGKNEVKQSRPRKPAAKTEEQQKVGCQYADVASGEELVVSHVFVWFQS